VRDSLSAYAAFFSERRFYRTLLIAMLPVLIIGSTFLGWIRGGGAPDVILKWIQPETSEASSLYVASPDPAQPAAATVLPVAITGQSSGSAPIMGATVISFRSSPAPTPLAGTTQEAKNLGPSLALPGPPDDGEVDAVIASTQKLQEAEREIDDMRRQLAEAEWDLNLWRQQAASGLADRDRARKQLNDVTQQLRQNYLELNSAQDLARTQQHDAHTEQDRLKQLLKLQNACQNHTTRAAD
jgi:hypothetical protein